MPHLSRRGRPPWLHRLIGRLGGSALASLSLLGLHAFPTSLAAQTPVHILKPANELVWSLDPPRPGFSLGTAWKGKVAADGTLNLGPYGTVRVAGLTLDQARAVIAAQVHPRTQPVPVMAGDVLAWRVELKPGSFPPSVSGTGTVGPDGTLGLGEYGSVVVAGLMTEQVRAVIEMQVLNSRDRAGGLPVPPRPEEKAVVPVVHREVQPADTTPPPMPEPPSLTTLPAAHVPVIEERASIAPPEPPPSVPPPPE